MTNNYYPMIFKRKSFHLFRNVGEEKLEASEITDIENAWNTFEPLYPDIKTAIRIVPSEKVNFKRDAEYCILMYSEKKDNYLLNMGYLGEQLDLFLVEKNIGTLWFGIGKADEKAYNGLDHVITIAVHPVPERYVPIQAKTVRRDLAGRDPRRRRHRKIRPERLQLAALESQE